MTVDNGTPRLTAEEVLRRYKDELPPEFCEIPLEDVNQVGNFGDRPLHVATGRGSLDEVAALLDGGADVNAAGELGNTPLHEAVSHGHLEVITFLLDHGASLHDLNDDRMTALDIAKLHARNDITELLNRWCPTPISKNGSSS